MILLDLFKFAPTPLVSVVASLAAFKDSWYSIVLKDLEWIISVDSHLSHFTVRDLCSPEFLAIVTGPKWRDIVVDCIGAAQMAGDLGTSVATPQTSTVPCPQCSKLFSLRQLPGHMHRVHSYIHPARTFAAEDGVCRACLQVFHNRPRLIHHLRGSSPECFIVYQAYFDTLPQPLIRQLDEQDRSHAARCKKLGNSKLHASRPAFRLQGPTLAPISSNHAKT